MTVDRASQFPLIALMVLSSGDSIIATANSPISIEVSQDPVNIGDTVEIRCLYSGSQSPRYQWTRANAVSLPNNAQVYGNILRFNDASVEDSGPYICRVDTPEQTLTDEYNLVVHGREF